ncbi:hypothetical protein [Sphingobium sp.]|uniref:hypothetical protein n=1 Tax=Sphingobium sp. TaxID=1912891 RepID=UPI0035C66303
MGKLRQTFANPTESTIFLNLELSTSRFRLNPGEELMLLYDPADRAADGNGSTLRIELVQGTDCIELVIYTAESVMFYPDGRAAPLDFGPA